MSAPMLRGRSLTPGSTRGRKRSRSKVSRGSLSLSSLASSASRQDTRRAWNYGQSMSRYFDPFPSKMRAIMRYSQVISLDPGLAGTGHWLFRANSIFDPDFTGAGHQPYGHDTYELIYNHYQVIKSVCKVTWTETTYPSMLVGITMTDDSVVSGTYDTVREIKPTKVASMTTAGPFPQLTQQFVSTDVFGFDAGGKTTAAFGANPADQNFFDIWAQAANTLVDPGVCRALVNITYYVELTELKDLGQS